jgi:hypothetical protein
MKIKVASLALLLVFLLLAVVPAEVAAGDLCSPTVGSFNRPFVSQEEGDWCWVASAKVVTDFFNRQYQPPTPLHNYEQCRLYDIGRALNLSQIECCGLTPPRSDFRCLNPGWPGQTPNGWPNSGASGPLDLIPQPVPYTFTQVPSPALTWYQVKEQICPSSGGRGQPFIFYYVWTQVINGTPRTFAHTEVVEGYQEVLGRQVVLIDEHMPVNSPTSTIYWRDYECLYLFDANCTGSPNLLNAWHGGDYTAPADTTSPITPMGLKVQ